MTKLQHKTKISKNPYKYITDDQYKRFMGTTKADIIFTTVLAIVFIALLCTVANAQPYDTAAMDKFAEAQEVKLVKAHMINTNGTLKHRQYSKPLPIDGREPCVTVADLGSITIPVKIHN